MTLKVDVSGSDDSPVSRFSWTVASREWADEVQPMVQDAIKAEAPVGPGEGSGRLRASIRSERAEAEGVLTIMFAADVPYAGYVVDGTAPHVIRPRNAQALHWTGPGGGVFAKVVNHPGTKPNSFAERAILPLLEVIQARLDAALADQLSDD